MLRLEDDRVFVDSFQDVIEIKDSHIRFLYPNYKLEIQGDNLKVAAYSKQEMIIFGRLTNVEFLYDH